MKTGPSPTSTFGILVFRIYSQQSHLSYVDDNPNSNRIMASQQYVQV